MKKVTALLLSAVMVLSLLAGCGGSGNSGEPAVNEPEQQTAQSGEEAVEQTVDTNASFDLRFISSMSDENRTNLLLETAKKFNEKWPNVKIVNDSGGDYAQKMKLSLSTGDGHELVYVDDLNQQTLQRNNYLMDITQDVLSRGWIEKQVKGAVEFNNLRTPGKYYSVPFLMAPIVMYYNENIFKELGVEAPKNMDEFWSILDKASKAGYIAFENSGDTNYTLLWFMYHIIYSKAPKADIDKWYYGQETPESVKLAFIDAFKTIKDMADKGYFRKNYQGVQYDSVPQLYGQGKTALLTDGDWNLAAYEQTGIPTGIVAVPSMEQNPVIVNATDGAWALNANLSDDRKAAALDYIDAFMDEGIAKMWYEGGLTSSVKFDAAGTNVSPMKAKLNEAVANTSMGFYLDNAMPGLLDVLVKNSQMLLMNKITPEQCWEAINTEYEKQKAQKTSN